MLGGATVARVREQPLGWHDREPVEPLLRLDNLTKRYPGVTALDGLTLEVPRGRVGLVGANGAGKTTMFRLLLGLAHPTEGTVEVCGQDVASDPDRRPLPARLHARARLPPPRSDGSRHGRHLRRAERHPRPGGAPAGVGHPRPRRTRRGPVPTDRRLLDRHAPAHQARPGPRRRPRADPPRRADRRPRPTRTRGDARPRRPARVVRHLRADGDAPARRRAAGLRPRRDDRCRPARRRRGHRVTARAHRSCHRRRRWRLAGAARRPGAFVTVGHRDRRPRRRRHRRRRATRPAARPHRRPRVAAAPPLHAADVARRGLPRPRRGAET